MRERGYPPYQTLEQWSEDLVPCRYPNDLCPINFKPFTVDTCDISVFLALIGGGCREADIGSDILKVRLLEAKVETKGRIGNVLVGDPGGPVV